MVKKLKKIIEVIEKEFGTLSLFAILKMDEIVDKWSVIVAADWISESTEPKRNALFKTIFDQMNKVLNEEENASISRLGLFGTENHIVQELKKLKLGEDGTVRIKDEKVNGNMVHEGIILKS